MWERLLTILQLDYCDLPTMLSTLSSLLRACALNIDKKNKKAIPVILYILQIVMSFNYFYVYLISMIWYVFVRYPETGDLVSAMVFASLGISSEIGIMKLFYFHLNCEKIRDIVEEYLACDAQVKPGSRFANNIFKKLRVVKKRAIVYWLGIMLNAIFYIATPLIKPGRHMTEDHMVIYGLEPKYETPYFEIGFFISCIGVFFICYAVAHISAFIIIINGYTEAQMTALSEEIIHLRDDATKHYQDTVKYSVFEESYDIKNIIINDYVREHLKFIIKGHAKNINMLSHVEAVLKHCVAIGFLCLILGLLTELLGGLENTFLQLPFALIQVGMDCYTGQKVIDASEVFSAAVYDSKWENFDKSNMQMVLLILLNSQKTMKLSAGGLTTLSFGSLMSILKSTYSAYTTLRTMV
uniref:Odorant receptor n=1 Tax=Dendrolimus houi TaxID=765132 RepID=A0A076E995_9NEOP|nr:odorant receptor [Dendrolimus houi]